MCPGYTSSTNGSGNGDYHSIGCYYGTPFVGAEDQDVNYASLGVQDASASSINDSMWVETGSSGFPYMEAGLHAGLFPIMDIGAGAGTFPPYELYWSDTDANNTQYVHLLVDESQYENSTSSALTIELSEDPTAPDIWYVNAGNQPTGDSTIQGGTGYTIQSGLEDFNPINNGVTDGNTSGTFENDMLMQETFTGTMGPISGVIQADHIDDPCPGSGPGTCLNGSWAGGYISRWDANHG